MISFESAIKKKKVSIKCHSNRSGEQILVGKEESIKMLSKEVTYELLDRKL
jgi:hypothetical protein